jgi:hypothetical protein
MNMELKEFKSQYGSLASKYGLPDFKELNENFEIDRIERDVDFLLREIRKAMMDKIVSYIRLVEMMLNPSQAPPMFMMFVKNISEGDKKVMEAVYQSFIELELRSLKLEIDYVEESEAKAIKHIIDVWHGIKPDLRSLIGIMEKNWGGPSEKKDKGYFG